MHTKSWQDKHMWPQMQSFQLSGRAEHCTRSLSVLVGSPASHPFPMPCPLDSTNHGVRCLPLSCLCLSSTTKSRPNTLWYSQISYLKGSDCPLPHALQTCTAQHKALHAIALQLCIPNCNILVLLQRLPTSPSPSSFSCNCLPFGTQSFLHPPASTRGQGAGHAQHHASNPGKCQSIPANDVLGCPEGVWWADLHVYMPPAPDGATNILRDTAVTHCVFSAEHTQHWLHTWG